MGDESERTRGALGGVGFAFLMGFVACVAIARDPAALLGPPLLFEDGRDVLAFFYDTRGPSTWFREWAGYVVLVPNLIGWFALAAPIEWSPWLLSLGSLGLATLALCFIARADYGDLEPVAVVRAGGVIVLALMPVLHHLFWFNSIYSVWSANLLLVLLTLAPAPADTQTRLVRGFAMALLIFSHALSLVLLVAGGFLLAVPAATGVRDVDGLVAHLRRKGDAANYGSPGIGFAMAVACWTPTSRTRRLPSWGQTETSAYISAKASSLSNAELFLAPKFAANLCRSLAPVPIPPKVSST